MHKIASNALRLCFKLLLPCPQIGNNAWEWSYGKHDEQEFTGLNIVWVGTILDGIFWIAIIWVGIFQVGIFLVEVILGGSFPGGNFPGGIVRVGVILVGNFLWWGVFRVGTFRRSSSGWEFPGGRFPSTHACSGIIQAYLLCPNL